MIPVIIGATGTISKSLRQFLSNVPGKHGIMGLLRDGHIGHCTQTVGSANVKVQNMFNMPNNITIYSINCKYRTAATLYVLAKWFV